MGSEQPFVGRLRLAATLRTRQEDTGQVGVDLYRLSEQVLSFSAAYAPADDVTLALTVPVVRRQGTAVNLAQDTASGLGDVDIRARWALYRDRLFSPRHLLGLVGGLELPTGVAWARPQTMPLDILPGGASLDMAFGGFYAFFRHPTSLFISTEVLVPTWTRDDLAPGLALRTALAGQLQPNETWGGRLVLELRADRPAKIEGLLDEDTGGIMTMGGMDLVWSPLTDWVLQAGFRHPLWHQMRGDHREGWVLQAAVVVDAGMF